MGKPEAVKHNIKTQQKHKKHTEVKAQMHLNGDRSVEFQLQKGVEQGNTLTPLLFIIVIDRILQNKQKRSPKNSIGYKDLRPTQINCMGMR